MRKKALFPILTLVLVLALSIPMAVPAMAHTGAHTTLTMSASATEVCAGETVILTITEYNTGALWSSWTPLSPAWVELEPVGLILDNESTAYGFYSNLDYDDILYYEEYWQWTVSVQVNVATTFVATGHGLTRDGYDVTWPAFPERAEVTVDVVPCPGGEGCTPGYWKNHVDMWPAGIEPGTPFIDYLTIAGYTDVGFSFMDALTLKGGNVKALVRHAAAAVLSALHPDVDYPVDLAGIQAIIDDPNLTTKEKKDLIESYNELGCEFDG